MTKDFISLKDLSVKEIEDIFSLTFQLKAKPEAFSNSLRGKTLGLIFLKPSLRTRVSFEAGMNQLGGHTIYLAPEDIRFGTREAIKDFGEVLSRYIDGLVMRTFSHQQVLDFADCAKLPVINGLTDLSHPCQALSDLFTIKEKRGSLSGIKLAYAGDGNNVAHSLLFGCAKLGMTMTTATPPKYAPDKAIFAQAKEIAEKSGAALSLCSNPQEAVKDADIIYTDVWTSMGKEAEYKQRKRAFSAFQVNAKLISSAKADCYVMHCLPAHRGEEITDEVIDGPHSIVFDQAENRMHLQKALLLVLLKGKY